MDKKYNRIVSLSLTILIAFVCLFCAFKAPKDSISGLATWADFDELIRARQMVEGSKVLSQPSVQKMYEVKKQCTYFDPNNKAELFYSLGYLAFGKEIVDLYDAGDFAEVYRRTGSADWFTFQISDKLGVGVRTMLTPNIVAERDFRTLYGNSKKRIMNEVIKGSKATTTTKANTTATISSVPTVTKDGKYMWNGVDFSGVFNYKIYADRYPDLKAAFGYDKQLLFKHFIEYGVAEGRTAI